jgi:alcohol dehydrogenase (cytochrome c)
VQRGTEGAALYTNSTLALDPDTGEIEWYFQHIPAETHDLDEVFEIVLVDRGDGLSLFKMGKIGVLWELDPRTGAFRNAFDLGYQNIVDIDPVSGQGILVRERIPQIDVPVDYCPGPGGLKNLWAMAYHPETEAFYVPLTPGCAHSIFGAMPEPELGGGGVGPNDRRFRVHPDSPEQLGDFVAMDSRTGELLWRRRSRWQYGTAVLTTGGGLVFVGDIDRYMYAFDARDGTELWRTRTPTATDGFPITYAVDGRQYLAVPSGPGWSISWRNARIAFPETMQRPPGSGSVLQVFALPLDD